MRAHHDQVAGLVLRCIDNGLPRVIVARPESFHCDATRLGGLLNEGEFFGRELLGFRVNDAGDVGRDQAAWRCQCAAAG